MGSNVGVYSVRAPRVLDGQAWPEPRGTHTRFGGCRDKKFKMLLRAEKFSIRNRSAYGRCFMQALLLVTRTSLPCCQSGALGARERRARSCPAYEGKPDGSVCRKTLG